MREIKFRAWDKVDEQMLNDVQEVSYYNWAAPLNFRDYLNSEEYILMQYTGLKDKNDKEIYEGDIVKHGYDNCNGSFYSHLIIDYVASEGCFKCGKSKRLTANMVKEYNIEVIGNIYENSELLRGNKNE